MILNFLAVFFAILEEIIVADEVNDFDKQIEISKHRCSSQESSLECKTIMSYNCFVRNFYPWTCFRLIFIEEIFNKSQIFWLF